MFSISISATKEPLFKKFANPVKTRAVSYGHDGPFLIYQVEVTRNIPRNECENTKLTNGYFLDLLLSFLTSSHRGRKNNCSRDAAIQPFANPTSQKIHLNRIAPSTLGYILMNHSRV